MTKRAEKMLKECKNWPPEERADLAAQILESLDENQEVDVYQAWDAEIAARLEELDKGLVELIPAEEVHREIQDIINAHRLPPTGSR